MAASRLPLPLGRGDDQPVRHAGLAAGAAAGGDPRPRGKRLQDRGADERRVPALPPLHAPGRRLGRSPAAKADSRARQRRPRARAPVGADRLLGRRPDDLAALRRRLRRRRLHRLLRRRLSVLHPRAGRQGGRRRGELEARDQPSGREHRRPRHGRRPRRAADRPGRSRSSTRSATRSPRCCWSGSASRRRRRRAPSAGRSGPSSGRDCATSSGIPTSGRWW